MAIRAGIGFGSAPENLVLALPTISLSASPQGLTPSGGLFPTGYNQSEYTASARILWDDYSTYTSTADLQDGGVFGAAFGSGGSAVNACAKYTGDAVFPHAIIVTQIFNDDDASASGASPELIRSFAANDNVWFRHAFRHLGTSSPDFAPTADFTTAGTYPTGHANSYKNWFVTWSGSSNRMDISTPNATNYLMGAGMASVTSRTEQNLVTLYGQPSGTNAWLTGGQSAVPTGVYNGAEWWEFTAHWKKLSSTSCVWRYWLRQLTTSNCSVFNPQAYYFNGLLWTNCTGTVAQAGGIKVGANRNKTAPTDGAFTELYANWSTANRGPFKGMHLVRSVHMVLDGDVISDPFGIGTHGGGPY